MQLLLSVAPGCSNRVLQFSTAKGIGKEARGGEITVPERQNQMQFLKTLAPPLMAALIAFSPICNTPVSLGLTVDVHKGARLFRQACIGCHTGGGNIIQPGATLFNTDLERNGVATEDDIYRITYNGEGRMPGFGENCTPRGQCTFGPRLLEDDIKLLAEFVKLQADQGWPNIESYGD